MGAPNTLWFMVSRLRLPGVLTLRRPPLVLGFVAAALGVAAATGAIYGLKQVAPVVSLSVVYLPAVLLVSALWGLSMGLGTSVLSAAAFNFFHVPPVGRFTIADSRDWVALAAFTTVAIAASAISELARARSIEAERRREEADLAAALARELLAGQDTQQALQTTARRLASALGLGSASLELGSVGADQRRSALQLRDGAGAQIATLLVPRGVDPAVGEQLQTRVVPVLAALVGIALRRDAMQAEAVETEALRRSDDVKTALLRAVSHDLRTPLTAIVTAGHALRSSSLTDDDRSELATAVVEEGERLAALVEKLLDLSRLQAGGATPRRDWVSIEEVIDSARQGLPASVEVHVTIDPELPEIRADAAQLERALANLLENAARFSPMISVNVRRSGGRAVIGVVDRGPGIAAADRERIFQPFYRGSGSASTSGSGLGLAIAKGFVEAGGGTITVDSLPGQGASFLISLPLT